MTKKITPERRRELAGQFDLNEQYLYQCLTGRADMEPKRARRIEDETAGEVTRLDLCQRTWRAVWPELADPQPTTTEAAGQANA